MRPEDMAVIEAKKKGIKPAMIRKQMFAESEKVWRRPARLFHATPTKNFESIKEKGILPHSFYGQIYLCEDPEQCLRFVKEPCVIFEIDTKLLDIHKLVFSKDHNRAIFRFDVYAYYKRIFPSALKNWSVYQ
jgi:hypothetical protein